MQQDPVYKTIVECLQRSCDLTADEIGPDKYLASDLDVDSIDMLDLLFELERAFKIKVTVGELEKRARSTTGDDPFEIDGILTDTGLARLRELMPEVPAERFRLGMSVQEIPSLFTVTSIYNLVKRKLDEK